ncbi:hypothetical protein Celaphus_00005039 [Cervus elaphus hippelaphus]|uniref:Uncharacterized protein n=1 Tax=Cervus elaphus hippelaphus TaxID=46360 RepID=A0A212CWD6_CEREH|nr:hypothetical protein Celaphus_00005039 [Cervus elaphus hippelaphus]
MSSGEIPGKFSHQWRQTLDPWLPEAEATCDFPVTARAVGWLEGSGLGWPSGRVDGGCSCLSQAQCCCAVVRPGTRAGGLLGGDVAHSGAGAPACTPGPAAYNVEDCYRSQLPSAPGVVIQGVRRPKRHDTGPFCAL